MDIHAEIGRLKAEQAAIPTRPNKAQENKLFELQGRINALDNELASALRTEAGASGRPVGRFGASLTERAFGPRASFKGLAPGFRAAITIPAGPAVADQNVPGFGDVPRGFADTLMQAPTESAITYLRRGARVNGAAQWSTGDKASSSYTWTEHTAPLAWIAHHTPISKTQASDWNQLDNIVQNEMLLGLAQARSREALIGSNSSGIVGVLNTAGLQLHTVAVGDNVYDAIRRAATKVLVNSGFAPTHVAVAPEVDETMDLLTATDGQYLQVKIDNRVWRLEVVVDAGLTVVDGDTTHYGFVVYSSSGAAIYTKETDNVQLGLVDDQFINNAYTLLAEGRHALAVRFPDAFCYCADAIDPVVDASS